MKNTCKHQRLVEIKTTTYNVYVGEFETDYEWVWKSTQEDIDLMTYNLITAVIESPNLKNKIGKEHPSFGRIDKYRKPIIQMDLEGNIIKEWDYLRQVDKFGMDHRNVGKVLRGKRKTYKKSLWKYK
jgi:hypothetical protein